MTGDGKYPNGSGKELTELVDTLHRTFEQIREIVGGQTDTVTHLSSGTSYLLPESQAELHWIERMERRLASERAAILDALPAQIALLDHDGKIITVNAGWRRFAQENHLDDEGLALGSNYLEICDNACGPHSDLADEAAAGIRAVLDGNSDRFTLEYPCHSWDEKRWFELSVTALEETEPRGIVVMHINITDRVLAQHKADELRRRLERLIDQSSVGILVHRNFEPVLVNRQIAHMLGYDDPEEILVTGDARQLFAEDEIPRLEEYNRARLEGRLVPEVYQVRGNRRDGGKLILENRAFTIKWGEAIAVCAMLTDITAQVEAEEQLRQALRLDAVGQLTGGIAHDFNNLLTVILGNAELLAESLAEDQRLGKLAAMTTKAAERGAELTERLLAFARRQPLDPKTVDVNRQIGDMDTLLDRTLGEHVEVEFVRDADLWPALIDPGQLENAILNLCLNARDAMPDGGQLTIETANAYLDATYAASQTEVTMGQYVMVAVTDTGEGMEPAALRHAFEPFFTTKEVGKGSGLGLSMVYGFVKQSNGHVRVYSEPGQGTTVRMYLPRADGEATGAPNADEPAPGDGGSERILMVEDDELVRGHVLELLEDLGYHVVPARNGVEALELIRGSVELDLLFTDLVMPGGMDGRQLAEAARGLRPDLPVLFTSGYAENAAVHHGRLDKGVRLLQKPYRKQDLARMIRQALQEENTG